MSCQIVFLGSPQVFASNAVLTETASGFLPAAVIAGGGDGGAFPGAKRFPSLKEAFFAFPSLEAAAVSPSFSENADEFYENAAYALSHGKHLFAAVPPSLPSESLGKLLSLAKEAGCLFFPFLPGIASDGFREAAGALSRRAYGEVLLASEEVPIPAEPLFAGSDFAGSLRDTVLPSLLRMRILFGKALSVSALAERSGTARASGIQRPDAVTLQIRFASGPIASAVCRPASANPRARFVIAGQDGEFSFDPTYEPVGESGRFYGGSYPDPDGGEFGLAFADFLLALREEEPRDALPPEALLLPDAVRYAEAAVSSALAGGQPIRLTEF